MEPPRALIEGDAIGLADSMGVYWVPLYYVRTDGERMVFRTITGLRYPCARDHESGRQVPTARAESFVTVIGSKYGDGPSAWRFADEVQFYEVCPACAVETDEEYEAASRNILAEGFKYPKKTRWDCQTCKGEQFVAYEPFAKEPHI